MPPLHCIDRKVANTKKLMNFIMVGTYKITKIQFNSRYPIIQKLFLYNAQDYDILYCTRFIIGTSVSISQLLTRNGESWKLHNAGPSPSACFGKKSEPSIASIRTCFCTLYVFRKSLSMMVPKTGISFDVNWHISRQIGICYFKLTS